MNQKLKPYQQDAIDRIMAIPSVVVAVPMETNNDECRAAFEEWFEPSGRGLDKDKHGNYKFMVAQSAWKSWKAGWEAARRTGEEA